MLAKKQISFGKILALASCILAGTFSVSVAAFTLGDVRLESSLNQPLQASIQLLELDGLDNSQILVALGSEADFERIGVEPLPLLNNLDFEVEVYSATEGAIIISSDDAIVEPYLNFVLNVRWPSGRVIREYTVLLDLPTFTANPVPVPAPAPAQSSPRAAPAPTPTPAPRPQQQLSEQPASQAEPEPEPRQFPEQGRAAETVVIQPGDSLWNIALATRPDNGISVQQMMLAIQRANSGSDAFINNNINGIRAGRVLRIPDRQEISAITQEQAINQVAIQNQQFSGAQPLAVNNTQGTPATNRDELSIISGSDANQGQGQQVSGLNDTISALEAELALSEESLDAARMENEELRSRLADLEEQIGILENIIAIEDQRMAELQAQLAEQGQADVLAVNETQTPATPTPAPASTPAPAPANVGIVTQLSNFFSSTMGMGLALLVLLALVVGFLVARNRQSGQDDEEFDPVLESSNSGADYGMQEADDETEADELAATSAFTDDALETEDEYDSDSDEDFIEDADIGESDAEDDFDEVADDAEDEDESDSKAGFLAGLFARFSRKKADDDDEDDYIDTAEELYEYEDDEDASSDEQCVDVTQPGHVESDELEIVTTDDESDEEEREADESNAFEFKLDDSINIQDSEAEADTEEHNEVESFEFSVNEQTGSDEEVEALAETDEDEVETFDFGSFSMDEPSEQDAGNDAQSAEDSGDEAEEAEDIEEISFEFDGSDDEDSDAELDVSPPQSEPRSSLGNLGVDGSVMEDDSDEEELEMITDQDEVATKLDLAVAYQAMEDLDGAREILNEVIAEGNEEQIAEAKKLLDEWGDS